MLSFRYMIRGSVLLSVSLTIAMSIQAQDWNQFRGPDGSATASDDAAVPTRWSPLANLDWKTELPGPGVSSPIIVGDKVFVTCYSGYGLSQEQPGEIENLVRHLVCVDLQSGEVLWQRDVKASLPEDPYAGIGVTAHGYASHTPFADGEQVYAFFGKSGVHAFDFAGNPIWQAEVGKESDPTQWGSSSSPLVYKDVVIVVASAESQAIVGIDKTSGKELWRQEAKGLDGMWATPSLVKVNEDRTDLVLCVSKEFWGMDPQTGKLRWFASATDAEQAYSSLVLDGNRVFAFTGRGGGSIALDVGGNGDVSDTNTVWTGNQTASFASPVRYKNRLFSVAQSVLTIVDAESGNKIDEIRLEGALRTGGRFGSLDYPSPIVVGDRLFYLNGSGQMFVFDLAGDLKQVAVNRVTEDKESFGGTPAVSAGRMILRSDKHLYCVSDKQETVAADSAAADSAAAASIEPVNTESAGAGQRPANQIGSGGQDNNRRFDPISMFNDRDADKDGRLTAGELAGSPLADRLDQLDKDGDKAVSQEEFRSGMATLFGGGRGSGGRPGGGGQGGGGGNDRGASNDPRPDRPQRPALAL